MKPVWKNGIKIQGILDLNLVPFAKGSTNFVYGIGLTKICSYQELTPSEAAEIGNLKVNIQFYVPG